MTTAPGRRGPLLAIATAALLGGTLAALHYGAAGLTLSHYDARAHLVVARRIADSITPGWQQIGAVWLPLPHLLDALPVQADAFFATGVSAVALSCVAYAVAATGIAWIVSTLTGSWFAAVAGTAVFALNPNVLYLQATPMTEPLLLALIVVSVGLLISWCARVVSAEAVAPLSPIPRAAPPPGPADAVVGWAFALACLTRYEAWPTTFAALAVAAAVLWRAGVAPYVAVRRAAIVAAYPVAAILGFTTFSRIVVGSWFATGFFVPENPAQGHPILAAEQIAHGLRALSGLGLLTFALGGVAVIVVRIVRCRDEARLVIPLALAATAAVPWVAFLQGHPFRIRYMVPLVAAQAILSGIAAGSGRRLRPVLGALLLAVVAWELAPLDHSAPMVVEAQRDQPNAIGRESVTACLRDGYAGETVMASMGSLGHYMQDLSKEGLRLQDFLHEGNGDIWLNALYSPRPFVGWILIEERAEGGDMLAALARERPLFLEGFSRVCEGGGLALFKRMESQPAIVRISH